MFRRWMPDFRMAPLLNKHFILFFLLAVAGCVSGQDEDYKPPVKDYRDVASFDDYRTKSYAVAAWQIARLKQGALVVRLKTNGAAIRALQQDGNKTLAEKKKAETFVINKNIMNAYLNHFRFCAVYFIYSNSSDSLQKGIRSGIFLDSNLQINPSIVLAEKYYLLAERDMVYTSSIGFVPQDTAAKVKETGNAIKEMSIVLKNKYGHQLKKPFPFYIKDKTYSDFYYRGIAQPAMGGKIYIWVSNENTYLKKKVLSDYAANGAPIPVEIRKHNLYKIYKTQVRELNDRLEYYYKESGGANMAEPKAFVAPYCY